MPRRSTLRALLCLSLWGPALAACAAAPAPAPACRFSEVDSLSLRSVQDHPVVTVSANGEPVNMLLDTGAETSVVTRATALRLRLPLEGGSAEAVTGIDGIRFQQVARATLALTGRGRVVRALVTDLPPGMEGIAGVLGVDVLSEYDIDLDQPGGRLTLLRAADCAADNVPWSARSWRFPAAFTTHGRVLIPVQLGEVAVEALLDTGVDHTVVAMDAARRAGLSDSELSNGTPFSFLGAALQAVTMREVLLPEVRVGPERFTSVPVQVPDATLPGANMLLGNDYLSHRRLLISWQRRAVFVRIEDQAKPVPPVAP